MSVDAEETVDQTVDQSAETETPEPDEELAASQASPEEEVTTEPDASSEEGAEEAEPSEADWITDDVRALAGSHEIEDAELASFESGADFLRACRLLDRTRTGWKAPAQQVVVQPEEQKPTEKEPAATPTTEEKEEDLALDLAKYGEYDEDTLRLVKAAKRLQDENKAFRAELANMNNEVWGELGRLRQERQQAIQEMELSRFHNVMDGMDEGMFGGEKELTEETDGRRKAVYDAYRMIVQSLPAVRSDGDQLPKLPSVDVLVRRAAMLAFGDEMLAAQRNGIYKSIHEQSRGRRPSPSRGKKGALPLKSDNKPMTIQEQREAILSDPEVAAIFDRSNEESGNAPQ